MKENLKSYSVYLFTALRILVGWHFLYEGVSKLFSSGWSAKGYLLGTKWLFSGFFHWLASSATAMSIVDFINIWGLILIGLSLFAGLLVRWSSIASAVLLLFYFVAYPPIPGYTFGAINEGSYIWVNENLIEMALLLVFVCLPADFFFGFDRLIKRWKEEKAEVPVPSVKEAGASFRRREILRDLISVPFIGAFAYAAYKKKKWDSFEEKFVTGKSDAISGATTKSFQFASLSDLKGVLPKGKIKDLDLSRMIMGGNLIGGWAHSRDLIYVSKLIKAYHSDERVINTLLMAEKCGINAILTNPRMGRIINKYWHETGEKMKFISDCASGGFLEGIRKSHDSGAAACIVRVVLLTDWLLKEK